MNKLPLEVLQEIFANLELEDLFSATGVCINWHCAICHLLATKRRILVIRDGAPVICGSDLITTENVAVINKRNFAQPLKQFLPALKHLYIVYDNNDAMRGSTIDLCECLDTVLKSAVNLVSLNLVGSVQFIYRIITSIIQNCSDTIQRVWLNVRNNGSDCCYSADDDEMRESLHLIENQMYGINLCETKITVAGPTASKVYAFYNNARLPTVKISHLTRSYNLCEIYLLNCRGLDARAYDSIRLATNLKTVTLKRAYKLDTKGVRAISKLPYLQTLSVSDATRVTENGWKCVFTELTSLKVLKLKNCTQLSDSVFFCGNVEAVCGNLRHLKLNLETCKQVTSAGLKVLLTSCVLLDSLCLLVDYEDNTVETIHHCIKHHLQRLSSSKITVQTASAVLAKPLFEKLSRDCSFVIQRTKIIVP